MTFTETSAAELRSRGRSALRNRTIWFFVLCVGILVLVGALGARDEGPRPYDPQSTEPDGTKAMVMLLEELGSRVTITTEVRGTTILLLRDDLTIDQKNELNAWVRTGGSLVVADPSSELVTSTPEDFAVFQPRTLRPGCFSEAVSDVSNIQPKADATYAGLSERGGTVRCFPVEGGVFLEIEDRELGTVATLATPAIFTNNELAKADNSVLVANLLGARDGGAVTVLQGADPSAAGDRTLAELIPEYLKKGFWQLIFASVLLLAWRSRRFGRPVEERTPVEVPASALVVAVGNLLQTAGQSDAASRSLRADLRRRVASLMGLPAGADPRTLARVASARTGIPEQRLLGVMLDPPPSGGQDVLSLAQSTEAVHREVSNAR